MKKTLKMWVVFVTLSLAISQLSMAQTDKPYKDGTVWNVSFIKTKPNMGDEYLKSLSNTWKKVNEEAVKQGLIVSYKVLVGSASNPGDWDILLMTETKNMAAMDLDTDAKWDAIYNSVVGTEEQQQILNQKRLDVRDIYGNKLMREIIFK